MVISKKQLGLIRDFSYRRVEKNDKFHQKFHIDQTVKLSIVLAKKEKVDVQKSIAIAYLHDIAKFKQTKTINHSNQGAIDSEIFLREIGLKQQEILDICYAIKEHNKDGQKGTKEAEIIYDADKLQAIGAYGIFRCLSYNLDIVHCNKNQDELFLETLKEIEFFQSSLYTKTGKKMAKKSKVFIKRFAKDYCEIRDAKI